jgi:sugar lactone lactonase YvrE
MGTYGVGRSLKRSCSCRDHKEQSLDLQWQRLIVYASLLLIAFASPDFSREAVAQTAAVFSSQPVGTPSQMPVTVNVPIGILGSIQVLTLGALDLDFSSSTGGTCTVGNIYLATSCTVEVNFSPTYPGPRLGAIVLLDMNGQIMATQYLSGIGIGSLSVLVPGKIATLAGDGHLGDDTLLAATSSINEPLGEAVDGAGNLYFSDSGGNRIRRVDAQGSITTVAGTGIAGFAGDGGMAVSAQINKPAAIAIDGAGNILFADSGNHAIRKIDITGKISTVAGILGQGGYSGDFSLAIFARLTGPNGIAFDAYSNLYIADTGNNVIREVQASNGVIRTIAGNGTAGDSGDSALATTGEFNEPWGVAVSSNGHIYVADFKNNRIRRFDVGGNLSTVVGDGNTNTLFSPSSVVVDAAGNLYIADSDNDRVLKFNSSSNTATTLAGNGTEVFGGDGFDANLAGLFKPYSLSLDGAGDLFISDRLNLRVREVSATIAAIAYPVMKEGKISLPTTQTLENDGNASLNLSNLKAPPTINATLDTVLTDPARTTCLVSVPLSVASACTLAVEFAPVLPGSPATGVLAVSSNSANSPVTVDLIGTVLSVDPTTIAVTSNLNPASSASAVTFTANIASPNQVTGTVEFLDGGIIFGTPQTVNSSSNSASITTSFATLGSHSITAVYSGDNANYQSTSLPLIQTIEQPTRLNVLSSAIPATVFETVTFTATLTGGGAAPTGNITFTYDSTSLGSSALISGGATSVAILATAILPSGNHTITASFAGDSRNFGSSYSFLQTVNLAPSVTALSTNSPIVSFGTPITFTAAVSGVSVSTPTGNVIFKDGQVVLGTSALNSLGVATYTNTTLIAGSHSITATYQGNADYAVSTSTQSVTETIQQASTSTALSVGSPTSIARQTVTFTAIVTSSVGHVPTGTVTLMTGTVVVCSGALSANGTVSCSSSNLLVGADSIVASYAGDSNNASSKSNPVVVSVQQAPTTTVLSSSQNPLLTLAPVVISATVTNGSTQSSRGIVTFTEDSNIIGVATLSANGIASISLPSLAVGVHNFFATYAGDIMDVASSATPLIQTVQLRPTTAVLTTSATSISGGQQVTLIAVVQWLGPVAPTGTVSFNSGTLVRGTATLDATGVATLTILPIADDPLAIIASYSGDAVYSGSSSSSATITVGQPPQFSMQLSQTSVQIPSGQNIGVDVTMTSLNQFTDALSLGCLGLPFAATCTFGKNLANLPSDSAATVHLVVDTGSPLTAGGVAQNKPQDASFVLACVLPGGVLFALLGWRGRRLLIYRLLLLFLSVCAVAGISGCNGLKQATTPAGTYTVRITASGVGTGVTQSIDLSIVVK